MMDIKTTQEQVKKSASQKQQKASNPLTSSWVTASAGSGKTKVLADRYLRLLLEGVNPKTILCLTFTNAAAAEMHDRISLKLQEWATAKNDKAILDDIIKICAASPKDEAKTIALARQLFAIMLDAVNDIKIQTIHAFCQHILKRFPLEAGISPHFKVMNDRDALEIMSDAKNDVFLKSQYKNYVEIADALKTVAELSPESRFDDIINNVLSNRHQILDLAIKYENIEQFETALQKELNISQGENFDSLFLSFFIEQDNKPNLIKMADAFLSSSAKTEIEDGKTIKLWLEASLEGKKQLYEEYRNCFLRKDLDVRSRERSNALKKHPDIKELLYEEADKHLKFISKIDTLTIYKASSALFAISKEIIMQYEKHKKLNALLDYDDLIAITSDLLRNKETAAWVLYKLDAGIDHILVDEAQDTNPQQWSIIEALSSEFFAGDGAKKNNRTIFAVGDKKQSIFSFQGADPAGFSLMKNLLKDKAESSNHHWNDINLDISFRSTRAVLQAVNETFSIPENQKGVLDKDESPIHIPFRVGESGLVELWPVIEPYKEQPAEPWQPPVERFTLPSPQKRLAKLIAQKIADMIDNKELLLSQNRPIEPKDIMILVKQRNGLVEDLIKELKNLKVATSGADRMKLTEQIAVMDLLSLAKFLLLPEDNLSLAEALRSPLIDISEEELFEVAYNRGHLTLWESLKKHNGENSNLGKAYDYLNHLLNKTDFIRPYELFAYILNVLNGRKKIVSRLGFEAEDCLDELLNLTLLYEKEHIPSLQSFVLWLETDETMIKRDLEKNSSNMVRIMTVHGAKGLQAPIVFLPDTTKKPSYSKEKNIFTLNDVLIWKPYSSLKNDFIDSLITYRKDRLFEEYKRLLYVAMTRAEDRLYICGYGKLQNDSWIDLVKKGIEPIAEKETNEFLKNYNDEIPSEILRLSCPQEITLPEKNTPLVISATNLNLPSWLTSNPEKEPTPPRPLAPSKPNLEEPSVFSPLRDDAGKKFLKGNLIHKLLQILPEIEPSQREKSALFYLRKNAGNCTEIELNNIIKETFDVINNPSFCEIFKNAQSRAEVGITGLVGKNIISGKIDRLLVTDDEVFIIDYKTSRMPPKTIAEIPPIYLYQMSSYKDAIMQIYPRKKIKCAIIWTAIPILMEIPDNIL
ncbi:MAG: double-strand break repair helicase AddA [Alphaproteobacteria bacterium]